MSETTISNRSPANIATDRTPTPNAPVVTRRSVLDRYAPPGPGTPPAPPPARPVGATGDLETRPVPYRFSGRELVLAVRPHQWIKNALVLLVPVVAGSLVHLVALLATLIATSAFCAASATTYLVNDLTDLDADKLHPTKQLRPIASGTLSTSDAGVATVVLGCTALALAATLGGSFVVILIGYLALTTAYSKRLKHLPVIDVITLAAGFVLRVAAGAMAVRSGVSIWLLAAVAAGAVLISVGKRHAEVGRLGIDACAHRVVLDWYRPAVTRPMMIGSEFAAVAAVGIWWATTFGFTIAVAASTVVALILERFRRLVLGGHVDDPVRVISHDRPIAAASLVLGVVMLAGVVR